MEIWTDGKAEVGRVREEKRRREKIREEEESKKEDAGAGKGKFVAPEGRKLGSLKRRVRSHLAK